MAATGTPTPNLGLRIPLGTDPASVDDINYNSNVLDTKIGAVGNTSVKAQIDALNAANTYRAGDSITGEWVFVGKATNAKTGFYGGIPLDKPATATTITISNKSIYGAWYSGGSRTFDIDDITMISMQGNMLWFAIGASGIESTNEIAWLRFHATISFS